MLIKAFRNGLKRKLEYNLLASERKVTEMASCASRQPLREGHWRQGTEEGMPSHSGPRKQQGVQQAASWRARCPHGLWEGLLQKMGEKASGIREIVRKC